MREASFRKRMITVFSGVFALANIFAPQAMAAENSSPNMLAYYDPFHGGNSPTGS
jgi:hypothetical protein